MYETLHHSRKSLFNFYAIYFNFSEEKNEPDKKKVKLDDNAAEGTTFSFSSLARENISEVRYIIFLFIYYSEVMPKRFYQLPV